jgi:hypothetical protein
VFEHRESTKLDEGFVPPHAPCIAAGKDHSSCVSHRP